MRKKLLPTLFLFSVAMSYAQQDFYALTGNETSQISFKDFRALDIDNSISSEKIFGAEELPNVYSQNSNNSVLENKTSQNSCQTPYIAALAYDEFTHQLIYVPMFSSNIYLLDINTKKITLVENNVIKNSPCDISSHITRMASGADGNIYAMNSSGTQFLQISRKDGIYTVANLGNVKDDITNGENLLGKADTGFGGDMIADAENNFYVFSASGNVFKLSTKNLNAKFLGKIDGLPKDYSVNGAAVDRFGKIILASMKGENFYQLNLKSLKASPLTRSFNINTYDLASKYLIDETTPFGVNKTISVFPTLVNERYFNVSIPEKDFKNNMSVEVYNFSGAMVLNKKLNSNSQKIELSNCISGIYIVNIKNEKGKIVSKNKIFVSN